MIGKNILFAVSAFVLTASILHSVESYEYDDKLDKGEVEHILESQKKINDVYFFKGNREDVVVAKKEIDLIALENAQRKTVENVNVNNYYTTKTDNKVEALKIKDFI